jgi:Bacterial mobilisation protein (MobC)
MSNNLHLMAWVSRDTKERFAALARLQNTSESSLLKRIVEASLGPATPATVIEAPEPAAPTGRISVRLPNDDLLLLRERAAARGLPAATYVSYLVRSHLRRLAPLPDAELNALKHAIGEIGAIGRNLNQIARAVNSGQGANGPNRADLHALLRACTGLRDAVKDVVNRNLSSWEAGYEKTSS